MAENSENPFEESGEGEAKASGSLAKTGIRLGLMAAVLAIGSVAGYGLGGLLGGPGGEEANQPPDDPSPEPVEPVGSRGSGTTDYEYFDFDAITVNLDLPPLNRYIRATITLAVRDDKDKDAALKKIENKKKEMHNWLTIYLSGLRIEDVRGPKNLNRIRREIQEAFNEQLWPNRRPLIDHVLFKEFAVQ